MVQYHVVYIYTELGGVKGVGSCQIETEPIRNLADLLNVRNGIMKEYGFGMVHILNWRRFED